MFSLRQDVLLLSLRPFEPLPMLPGAEERSLWDRVEPGLRDRLAAGAEAALVRPLPIAPASAFKRHLDKGIRCGSKPGMRRCAGSGPWCWAPASREASAAWKRWQMPCTPCASKATGP